MKRERKDRILLVIILKRIRATGDSSVFLRKTYLGFHVRASPNYLLYHDERHIYFKQEIGEWSIFPKMRTASYRYFLYLVKILFYRKTRTLACKLQVGTYLVGLKKTKHQLLGSTPGNWLRVWLISHSVNWRN